MVDPIDPIERLRAANPVDPHALSSASLARVSARTQENILSDIESGQSTPTRNRRMALAGLGGFAVVALAVFVGASGGFAPTTPGTAVASPDQGDQALPGDGVVVGGGAALGSCIRYEPSIIPTFDIAFDGTVVEVVGDQVTFAVNAAYKGVTGDTITLTSLEEGLTSMSGGVDLTVGGRLLVVGSGSDIVTCGMTQAYDPAIAADWAAAFGI